MLRKDPKLSTQRLIKIARPEDVAILTELLADRRRFYSALAAAAVQSNPPAAVSVSVEQVGEIDLYLTVTPVGKWKTTIEIEEVKP